MKKRNFFETQLKIFLKRKNETAQARGNHRKIVKKPRTEAEKKRLSAFFKTVSFFLKKIRKFFKKRQKTVIFRDKEAENPGNKIFFEKIQKNYSLKT